MLVTRIQAARRVELAEKLAELVEPQVGLPRFAANWKPDTGTPTLSAGTRSPFRP